MGTPNISSEHKKKLISHAHAGTLEQEVHDAIAYCKTIVAQSDWMLAAGTAVATATPKQVLDKLHGTSDASYLPDEVKFGGVLGNLDLEDRTKPMS